MFKNKLLKKAILFIGASILAIGSLPLTNVFAETTTNNSSETYQMFPLDYVDQYLSGINDNITINSYDLPNETDGYWRAFDKFLTGDMTTWLGQNNLAYAKTARNNWLVSDFLYRLSPADDNFANFSENVVPDLKKNGGTANLKLQVLNTYNSGQVLRELPITVNVPAPMSQLNINFQDKTVFTTDVGPSIFSNTYIMPTFKITDNDTQKSYLATKISPVKNVYLDGKKTDLSALPKTLNAGTYTQSIYFTVAGMSQAQLSQLASNSKIIGNDGNSTIRYSNGQLIATRTIVVE